MNTTERHIWVLTEQLADADQQIEIQRREQQRTKERRDRLQAELDAAVSERDEAGVA